MIYLNKIIRLLCAFVTTNQKTHIKRIIQIHTRYEPQPKNFLPGLAVVPDVFNTAKVPQLQIG